MSDYILDDIRGVTEAGYMMQSRPSISLQSNLAPVSYLATTDLTPWLQPNPVQQIYPTFAYDEDPGRMMAASRGGALLPMRSSMSVESLIAPVTAARRISTTAAPFQIAAAPQFQPTFISPQATALPAIPTHRVMPSMAAVIATQPTYRLAKAAPMPLVRLPVIRRF